jgi:hypothetical protein
MCETDADFTTIAGPEEAVYYLEREWAEIRLTGDSERAMFLADLGVHIDFPHVDRPPDAPALAIARHRHGDGPRIAGLLNGYFRTEGDRSRMAGLISEPGHFYTSAGPARGGGVGSLDPAAVGRARPFVPLIGGGRSSSRVALLDTGDARASNSMRDVTEDPWSRVGPAADPHGHGTAVADAIREIAPNAEVHPIRVLDSYNQGTSASVYLGLIIALWDASGFDVVNASLSVEASSSCGTSLAATFTYLMQLRATWSGPPMPRLVVAAANNRATLGAPATAAGATVVTGLDLTGAVAPYSSALVGNLPPGVVFLAAPGGTDTDPLGRYANGDPIYGNSFAAGFVSGALAA